MPKSDAADKLRKAQLIEGNWDCPMPDVVPVGIRARENKGRKSKAPVGSSLPELHWHHWSYKLIHELEKISCRTSGKLAFAQELMILEVRQRQQDLKNHMRAAAEVLLQDLEGIDKDLTEDTFKNLDNDNLIDGDEASDDEDEDDVDEVEDYDDLPDNVELSDDQLEGKTENDSDSTNNDKPVEGSVTTIVKIEDSSVKPRSNMNAEDDKVDFNNGIVLEGSGTTVVKIEDSSTKARNNIKSCSHRVLKSKAKILQLRADAMRLKQEAAKRLAEPFELEAKILMAEDT